MTCRSKAPSGQDLGLHVMTGCLSHPIRRAVAVLLFVNLRASPVNPHRPAELRPGQALSSRISRGEIHRYKLLLRTGQNVKVEVLQHEMDLAVGLVRPDGSRLPAVDGNEWSWESMWIDARSAGVYEVEVVSPTDDTAQGLYTLTATELKLCSSKAHDAEAAQALFHRGVEFEREAVAPSQIAAIDHLSRAMTLWRHVGDARREAQALVRLGDIDHRAGRYSKAYENYTRSLSIWDRLDDSFGRAEASRRLCSTTDMLGSQAESTAFADQFSALATSLPDRRALALVLYDRIFLAMKHGDHQGVIEAGLKALDLREKLGDPGTVAAVLNLLSGSYAELGRFQEAIAAAERVLRLRLAQDDQRGQAAALSSLGLAFLRMGRFELAIQHLTESLHLRRLQGDLSAQAGVMQALADAELRHGNPAKALTWMKEAMEIDRTVRAPLTSPLRRAGFSNALDLPVLQVSAHMALHKRNPGRGQDGQALLAADYAMGRHLFEDLPAFPKPSLAELQKELSADSILLEYWLNEKESFLWVVSATDLRVLPMPPAREIRAVAEQLANSVTARAQLAPGESAEGLSQRILRADARLRTSSESLSHVLLAPAADALKARRLYIAGTGILNSFPFSVLPDPSDARRRPLGLTCEIVRIPSVTAVLALQRARKQAPAKLLAVIPDPLFEERDLFSLRVDDNSSFEASDEPQAMRNRYRAAFTRLPFSKHEVADVVRLAPPLSASLIHGTLASRERLLAGSLSPYRIIHFATHGFFDSKVPEKSGIALAGAKDWESNQMLRLQDIYQLRLTADLVVLSACDTARGREFRSEAAAGLTSAFLCAGAAQVVSTAWKVDDEATAELIRQFYRMLLRGHSSPAAALRRAQELVAANERWNAPYYWAGFFLHGFEPRHKGTVINGTSQ